MDFLMQSFNQLLDNWDILKHHFYDVLWNKGKLTRRCLGEYACQYYNHVKNFPRYLSSIHSICDDINVRKVILSNLIEEEDGDDHHPELWLRFADGVGVDRSCVTYAKLSDSTSALDHEFFKLSRSSVAEGLGALFAYESQMPAVSRSKISTLKSLYNVTEDLHLKFFDVHASVDEWHSQACMDLINNMSEGDKVKSYDAASRILKSFWSFLDGIQEMCVNGSYLNA